MKHYIGTDDKAPQTTQFLCEMEDGYRADQWQAVFMKLRQFTKGMEVDRDKWKRMYETVVVKDEGMQLYEEITRLNQRIVDLEKIVKQGVWPK